MKHSPLRDKEREFDCIDETDTNFCSGIVFDKEDVLSAVLFLKQKVRQFSSISYGERKLWYSMIDEAFADVYQGSTNNYQIGRRREG